jgi:endo-1,4-beta-xylanase
VPDGSSVLAAPEFWLTRVAVTITSAMCCNASQWTGYCNAAREQFGGPRSSGESMSLKAHSRREFLAGTASATALTVFGTGGLSGVSAFATPSTPPAGATNLIPYGAAVRSDALAADLSYRDAVIANCQMVVPESELKWLELRPTQNEYRFEKADAIIDFARQNAIEVRGHTLAWYGALPPWTESIATRGDAERELTDHIETVVSRYKGAIPSWDVINEPLVDWPESAASLRPSIWARRLGPDYLKLALETAAAADPDAKLVLNEYDVEFVGPRFVARRKALIQLLRSLRDRDVPIHAVGLQAHLFADRAIDRDGLQALLAEIKALKLDVWVTELDVIDYELPGKIGERDALVAGVASRFLDAVSEVVRPKAILTWGLSDRYTWVPTYFKRRDGMPNRPLPLDAELKPKPLFDVIEEFRRKA